MPKLMLDLTPEQHRILKIYAAEENTNMNAVLRGWIEKYLLKNKRNESL